MTKAMDGAGVYCVVEQCFKNTHTVSRRMTKNGITFSVPICDPHWAKITGTRWPEKLPKEELPCMDVEEFIWDIKQRSSL